MMQRSKSIALLILFLASVFLWGAKQGADKGSYLMYIGTYTEHSSKGIYAYRFNAETGHATSLGLAAETTNPSFLVIDPKKKFLYAVNEISEYQGQKSGGVSAFAIDTTTGKLKFLNEVSSEGPGPCHITLDRTGKYVLIANYDGGSLTAYPVLKDGELGKPSAKVQHSGHGADPERQAKPHAHWIGLSPDNRFAFAVDLGLDKILVYRFDQAKGTLVPNGPASAAVDPGAGPRHFSLDPGAKFGYVINELGSTVTAFSYDSKMGALTQKLQTISTLPENFKGKNDTAEIVIHPNGKFLYGSNRGHDSIVVFAIDQANGALKPIDYVSTQGKTPRNFEIDPSGSYLFAADQDSDKVVVFRVDPETGRLNPTGEVLQVPSPVCVRLVALQ
jgi:6-phosphogluconolactonase